MSSIFNVTRLRSRTTEEKCVYITSLTVIMELICHLPDVYEFRRKGRLSFDPQHVHDLDWTPDGWRYKFNPDHVRDISDTAWNTTNQRSHHMQLRSREEQGH